MPELRLVIFDVDGTLVDSQSHIHASMDQAFRELGLTPPPLAQVLGIVGLSLPEAIAHLVPDLPLSDQARIVTAYKTSFAKMRAAEIAPLYPGARETVERMAARPEVILGLATGKSRRGLEHVLTEHDMLQHFVTKQVADDHPSKPNPSMLHKAMSETGIEASRTMMIGDTSFDMEMGRAAGVHTVGVSWGYHPVDRLDLAGAGRIITEFSDLDDVLDDLLAVGEG